MTYACQLVKSDHHNEMAGDILQPDGEQLTIKIMHTI